MQINYNNLVVIYQILLKQDNDLNALNKSVMEVLKLMTKRIWW